jgi:hypothetical protein
MIALFVAMSTLLAGRARADEANQTVKVKFSEAVQIPGQVLPAGTYLFVMADTEDRQIVQILSEDRSKSFGFVQTMNRQRAEATGGVTFTIAERGVAEPAAVIAWFYPGRTTGHEFLYPRNVEQELALAKRLKMGGGQSAAAFAFGFLTLEIWWSFIVRRRAICQNR